MSRFYSVSSEGDKRFTQVQMVNKNMESLRLTRNDRNANHCCMCVELALVGGYMVKEQATGRRVWRTQKEPKSAGMKVHSPESAPSGALGKGFISLHLL